MICKCGYNFTRAWLEANEVKQKQPYVSFMLVNDKSYKKFIKSEMKVLQAKNKDDKLKAIAKSATFTGSMCVCPECSRLTIVMSDGNGMMHYKADGATHYKV